MENSSKAINEIKEIFNKGLKNGIYDINDAAKFLNAIKYIEDIIIKKNTLSTNEEPIQYNKEWNYLDDADTNV
jgi:hypothetical protein